MSSLRAGGKNPLLTEKATVNTPSLLNMEMTTSHPCPHHSGKKKKMKPSKKTNKCSKLVYKQIWQIVKEETGLSLTLVEGNFSTPVNLVLTPHIHSIYKHCLDQARHPPTSFFTD